MGCLLWTILFVLCWPAVLLFLILYPVIWLLLLPFRLLGFTVGIILNFVRSIVAFPLRIVKMI